MIHRFLLADYEFGENQRSEGRSIVDFLLYFPRLSPDFSEIWYNRSVFATVVKFGIIKALILLLP
jgi:hypothetical protein